MIACGRAPLDQRHEGDRDASAATSRTRRRSGTRRRCCGCRPMTSDADHQHDQADHAGADLADPLDHRSSTTGRRRSAPDALHRDDHRDERRGPVEGVEQGVDRRLGEARAPGCTMPKPISTCLSTRSRAEVAHTRLSAASRSASPRRSGASSRDRRGWRSRAAATKNDAASSSATAQPPSQVNSRAPSSGPNRRNDSLVVCSEAFASTSISSGISSLSRPLSAAGSDDERDAVERGDRPDDPDLARPAHEHQRQHERPRTRRAPDQQRLAADPVDTRRRAAARAGRGWP